MKKSLPSIGIDKKRYIFESLDILLREAEKNDEKLLKKEFETLILQAITQCHQMGFTHVIFDCESTLIEMKRGCKE